ncbi:MAG: electron transfer flavoprotein subunit alpha/FixB family protein [Brevinema sp.]
MNIKEYKDIAVFIEQRQGEIQPVALELLSEARKLADCSEQNVIAILLGDEIKSLCDVLISYGADTVLFVDHKNLKVYSTEPYAQALYHILAELKPNIVLMGATTIGRDLAPRMSAKLDTGLTADCTLLEMKTEEGYENNVRVTDEKDLLMTRPTFGGNLIATIVCPDHRPQMSTVRPGVMQKTKPNTSRKGSSKEITISFQEEKFKVEVLEEVKESSQTKDITEYPVVVAGGRGIKKAESFQKLQGIANALGGGVAASRGLVDFGWADHKIQIGQTGKTVRPEVYLAFGISGAIQHATGMEESDLIIAINKDKEAPIFKIADLGFVCDLEPVISGLIAELKKNKG